MGEDPTKDQAPDGVFIRAVPQDDDTEGHRRPPNVVIDVDSEGVVNRQPVVSDGADDTEGHRRPPNVVTDADSEGVVNRQPVVTDDATDA